MASLFRAGKAWKIQFAWNGKRCTISAGAVPKSDALEVLTVIARLVEISESKRLLDQTTRRMVDELPPRVRQRIDALGLMRASTPRTVGDLLGYALAQPTTSDSTRKNRRHAGHSLDAFFTGSRRLHDITPGDADDFRRWLRHHGGRKGEPALSRSTVSRRCGIIKSWFAMAVRKGWMHDNPFADQQRESEANSARQHFVTRDDFDKLVRACTCPVFRACLALARYGGLRSPSETTALLWEWIDWEAGVMHVRAPKTKHIEGKAIRTVPLFPELRPFLEDAWHEAPDGAQRVLHGIAKTGTCLTDRYHVLCRKAKIKPWGKPWQNMRSSRETELVEKFPIHVACAWIGNSVPVASRHYLQITKDHLRAALEAPTGAAPQGHESQRCKSAAKVVRQE